MALSLRVAGRARSADGQNAACDEFVPRQSGIYRSASRQPWVEADTVWGLVLLVLLASIGLAAGVLSLLR